MINIQGRNHRDISIHDIDGVESTTHAYFKNRQIDLAAGEDRERGQGTKLENRERNTLARLLDRTERRADSSVGHRFVTDFDALVVAQ